MRLRPVNYDSNKYCGPAAISAVTGMTTSEAARLLRHVSGKRSIKGVHNLHMKRALHHCRIVMREKRIADWTGRDGLAISLQSQRTPTLALWLKLSKTERTAGRVFLISAGDHYQLISGRRFVCGLTRDVVSIRDKRVGRRRRVKAIWELLPFFEERVKIPREARA